MVREENKCVGEQRSALHDHACKTVHVTAWQRQGPPAGEELAGQEAAPRQSRTPSPHLLIIGIREVELSVPVVVGLMAVLRAEERCMG